MEETIGRIAIGEADRAHLKTAAKWSKFLAIVQFICIGLMLVIALMMMLAGGVMKASMAEVPGWGDMPAGFFTGYGVVLILIMVLMFFITLYLYNFAVKTLKAIAEGNDAVMTEAFANLGKYFRIQGILLIIYFAFLALAFVVGIIVAIVAA